MSPPIQLPEPWATMAVRAGGVNKLAKEFGITAMALRRWANKERRPTLMAQRGVNAWCLRRALPKPYPKCKEDLGE